MSQTEVDYATEEEMNGLQLAFQAIDQEKRDGTFPFTRLFPFNRFFFIFNNNPSDWHFCWLVVFAFGEEENAEWPFVLLGQVAWTGHHHPRTAIITVITRLRLQ